MTHLIILINNHHPSHIYSDFEAIGGGSLNLANYKRSINSVNSMYYYNDKINNQLRD